VCCRETRTCRRNTESNRLPSQCTRRRANPSDRRTRCFRSAGRIFMTAVSFPAREQRVRSAPSTLIMAPRRGHREPSFMASSQSRAPNLFKRNLRFVFSGPRGQTCSWSGQSAIRGAHWTCRSHSARAEGWFTTRCGGPSLWLPTTHSAAFSPPTNQHQARHRLIQFGRANASQRRHVCRQHYADDPRRPPSKKSRPGCRLGGRQLTRCYSPRRILRPTLYLAPLQSFAYYKHPMTYRL